MSSTILQTKYEQERGFSILELVIVIVIIAIMSTVAIIALRPSKELYKTDDQALKMIDMLQEARFRALSERRTIRVEINTVKNKVRIIDEDRPETAGDDDLIREMVLSDNTDIAIQGRPTALAATPATAQPCTDVVYAPSLHPTSAGERVAVIRFNLLGQALNAGVNDRGQGAVVTGATIYLWPPKPGSPNEPTIPTLVRAITVLGNSGTVQYWKYTGTTFNR